MMDAVKLGRSVKVDESETISNWTIDAIPPYDLIWSVNAMEREDCYVLGRRVHGKTVKVLKQEGYDVSKLAQRLISDENYWKDLNDEYKNISQSKLIDMIEVEIAKLYVKQVNKQGVWEYWVVTVADIAEERFAGDPQVIKKEKNPFDKQFCPIGIFRPIKRPGKMYGFGIIEPVMGVLDTEEDTLNMVTEAFWRLCDTPKSDKEKEERQRIYTEKKKEKEETAKNL
jgi:hypothetical protein